MMGFFTSSPSNLEEEDQNFVQNFQWTRTIHPPGDEGFQADYSWGAEARHSIKSFENGLTSFSDSLKQKLLFLGVASFLWKKHTK